MTLRQDLNDKILGGGKIKSNVTEKADVVIIGSGPGGAVAAKELSERGISVVILEEGGYFNERDFNQVATDMFLKLYRDCGSTMSIGLPPISMPLGKCVGGTAVINSGTCFRTPDYILRKWEILFGVKGCSPEEMKPYFDQVEEICHVKELPWDVVGSNALAVKRGADALGLTMKPLRHNARDCKGCGTCVLGCPDGEKESPNNNYIPMAIENDAKIYSRARVKKILTKNGRAAGVEGRLLDEGGFEEIANIRVDAPIVILAAGALHTPALLLHNKLANRSKQVGKNLSVHPASRVSALFEEEIKGWVGVPQGTYIDDFSHDGIMLEGIYVPPALGAPILPHIGIKSKELMAQYSKLSTYGVMISDTSRGRVRQTGIRPNVFYQMGKEDVQKMLRGMAILSRIYFAAGAKKVFTGIAGVPSIEEKDIPSIEDRKPKASDLELMAFHPLGSCRMGARANRSVVNSDLEAHDVKNLYITDGSVFPSSLGVNPQITIMAFATKAAIGIAQKG